MMDANTPDPPDTSPYDYNEEFSSVFYVTPFMWYYREPVSPYVFHAISYPTIQGDITSVLIIAAVDTTVDDLLPEYLQVFFDPRTEGWVIKLKNVFALTGSRSISYPDGGGSSSEWTHGANTLYKIGNETPTFTKPSIDKTIII
jgi:hypothetical protein